MLFVPTYNWSYKYVVMPTGRNLRSKAGTLLYIVKEWAPNGFIEYFKI